MSQQSMYHQKFLMFQMITNYEESQLECKFFSVETISFEHLHVVAMTIWVYLCCLLENAQFYEILIILAISSVYCCHVNTQALIGSLIFEMENSLPMQSFEIVLWTIAVFDNDYLWQNLNAFQENWHIWFVL